MKTTTETKTYLGDSVYAEFDGYMIVLTTNNGFADDPRNQIAMEPDVLRALDDFRQQLNPIPKLEEIVLPDSLGREVKAAVESALNGAEWTRKTCAKGAAQLAKIAGSLSDSVQLNSYGGTFWFTVSKREDVQTLMQLAPRWTKSARDDGIDYSAEVDGVAFRIQTTEGALPPTCRLVEQDVEIPAKPAEPAKMVKRLVVECAQPATGTSA
jgi:hypothetical protein